MRKLSEKDFIVWILWGEYAKKYKEYIPQSHVVIEGVHPSPLSAYRGFFGSRPFSKANKALEENGKPTIVW
jgi:uracil-DNA glycosylase